MTRRLSTSADEGVSHDHPYNPETVGRLAYGGQPARTQLDRGAGSMSASAASSGVTALSAPGSAVAALTAVVESCPTGALVIDEHGRLVHGNRAAFDLLGLDTNRILAAYRSDYLQLARPARALSEGATTEAVLRQVVRPDGASRWVEFRLVSLDVAQPGPALATVYLTDRSEDHRLLAAPRTLAPTTDTPAGTTATTRTVGMADTSAAGRAAAGQAEILHQIASSAPLELTMVRLAELIKDHVRGSACAVVQTGASGRTYLTSPFPLTEAESLLAAVDLVESTGPVASHQLTDLSLPPEMVEAMRAGGFSTVVSVSVVAVPTVALPVLGAALNAPVARPVGSSPPARGGSQPRSLGGLICLLREPRNLSAGELDILRAAADLAAIALERDRSERDLAQHALHDELTGLANRHLLIDRLEQALNRAKRRGRSLALMFLDLDRFKTINDSLGHHAGDQVLRQFAERLRVLVRPEDTVARFGGDEFVVLVEHVVDEQDAAQIAERLEGAMSEPFVLDGQPVTVTVSVGIVIGTGEDQSANLLRNADTAMYRAKDLGRNRTEIYNTALEAHLADRTQLGLDLRRAMVEGHLHLAYRPVISLSSGELHTIAAELRWQHPRHGRLNPRDLLAVADDTDQGQELGEWAIERGLADLAALVEHPAWRSSWSPPRLSIVLSGRQLAQPGLVGLVARSLARHRITPDRLSVTAAEHVVTNGGELVRRNLSGLHQLGVGLSLDEVGGAHSTALLSVLGRLPTDLLVVDRSVIAGLGGFELDTGPDTERAAPAGYGPESDRPAGPAPRGIHHSMAAGLLGLGHGLGVPVAAAGVDSPLRLRQVQRLGYDLAWGEAIGAAVTAARMIELRATST